MSKTILVWLLATFSLATVSRAEAQQLAKIPRVGFLRPVEAEESYAEAFRQELQKLGYLEGKNIALEYRSGKTDQLLEACRRTSRPSGGYHFGRWYEPSPGCQASNQQDPDCYDDQYRSCGDRAHC